MKSATKDKEYTSPVRKLVRFFEKSRDQWKARCREAKARIKCLKRRINFLEESRARWRQQAEGLKRELAEAQARAREREEELAAFRHKEDQERGNVIDLPEFALVSRRHQYSVGQAGLFISLTLSDGTSLRCAERVLATLAASLQLPWSCPSWYTGRFWILRLGYYKLMRAKEQADDWVWIVDHTVQIGVEKCLVILGVRLRDLPPVGQCLSHHDVEPIGLWPVEASNGEVVYQQLETGIEKTGVPRAIVSDHGTDLKAGIEQFCVVHDQTSAIYDIKHKTAAVLKHALGDDPTWQEFTRLAGQTKRQVQQTALAPLAPPQQRTKARYMNVEVLIQWGQNMLAFLDGAEESPLFEPPSVQEKLGWITEFRQPMAEWVGLLQVVLTTESYIRQRGLYHGVHLELEATLTPLASTAPVQKVAQELVDFVAQEEAKAHSHERLLGSSEIIESVLGKLKRLEQDQAKSGFTGLLLALCATVAATTTDVVGQALESVSTKMILDWCGENLGQSVQAKRRKTFASHGRPEQKWNQSLTLV